MMPANSPGGASSSDAWPVMQTLSNLVDSFANVQNNMIGQLQQGQMQMISQMQEGQMQMMNAQQSFMTQMLQRVRPPPPPLPPPPPRPEAMQWQQQQAWADWQWWNSQPADGNNGPTPGPNWGREDQDMGTTGFWV